MLVDGPAGAGKTTFARGLARALDAPVVSMDDIIPGWNGLAHGVERLMEWIVRPLARGGAARYRRYDWTGGRYAEWCDVGRPEVLVVEGVSCASREPAGYATFIVHVDAPRATRLERGVARDGPDARPRWERWMAEEDELFAREDTAARADLRVDG